MKKFTTLLLVLIATLTMSAQVVSDSVAQANGLWKENGFIYVDLGLPSGTCWATSNFGSKVANDPGTMLPLMADSKSTLDPADTFIGERWKLPTSEQWQELISNCDFYWNMMSGKPGATFRSKINGHFLFLSACGVLDNKELPIDKGVKAVYPCRDLKGDKQTKCYIASKNGISTAKFDNTYSLPIRAVIVKKNKDVAEK